MSVLTTTRQLPPWPPCSLVRCWLCNHMPVRRALADQGSMQRNDKDPGGLLYPGECVLLSGLPGVHSQRTGLEPPRASPEEGWVLRPQEHRKPVPGTLFTGVGRFCSPCRLLVLAVRFPAPVMRRQLCAVIGYYWSHCREPPLRTHPKQAQRTRQLLCRVSGKPGAQAALPCVSRCAGQPGPSLPVVLGQHQGLQCSQSPVASPACSAPALGKPWVPQGQRLSGPLHPAGRAHWESTTGARC